MKIAIFTDSFVPHVNGIVTSTINLVKGLADKGHTIYIIAPKIKTSSEFSYPNVIVKRIPAIPALFYPDFKLTSLLNLSILKFLKKEKIDIIHFQTPSTLGLNAITISKLLKVPIIGTYHTAITDKQYRQHMKLDYKLFDKLSWAFIKTFYNQCTLITCPSQSTKDELKIHFKKPIKVISNGIDLDSFNNCKNKKITNSIGKRGNLLIFVGRIAYEKNIFYLLESFRLILAKLPNTKLVIIGDGPEMKLLKSKVKKLKLEKNVIITGQISRQELLKSSIFRDSDLFVTASTTETQGITLLEAQANGLVCAGIDSRGIKDLIKNGYNGILIKNDDNKQNFSNQVVDLLQNKKLLKKMKKNTLIEVKKHDLKKIVPDWEKEYKQLIIKSRNDKKSS